MKKLILEVEEMLNNNYTIRHAAQKFGVSKSVLHRNINKKLKFINYDLYLKIKMMFLEHNKIRHIHGGEATKLKYSKE